MADRTHIEMPWMLPPWLSAPKRRPESVEGDEQASLSAEILSLPSGRWREPDLSPRAQNILTALVLAACVVILILALIFSPTSPTTS